MTGEKGGVSKRDPDLLSSRDREGLEGMPSVDAPGMAHEMSLDDLRGDEDDLPDQGLAAYEQRSVEQDPFVADYASNLKRMARDRKGARVDRQLRASLLEHPHLFPTPEEHGQRGGAAVWRSLRDQLHDESLELVDSSSRSELLALKRELESRRAIVAAVEKGLGHLLERLERRLEEGEAHATDTKDCGS